MLPDDAFGTPGRALVFGIAVSGSSLIAAGSDNGSAAVCVATIQD